MNRIEQPRGGEGVERELVRSEGALEFSIEEFELQPALILYAYAEAHRAELEDKGMTIDFADCEKNPGDLCMSAEREWESKGESGVEPSLAERYRAYAGNPAHAGTRVDVRDAEALGRLLAAVKAEPIVVH